MTRKEAARQSDYAQWLASGVSNGHMLRLIAALRHECRSTTFDYQRVEHAAHLELGRIKGIEELLFMLNDPLGEQNRELAKMPPPTYGTNLKPNA